jgi:flagellar biosynthesis chaperone FliJ
VSKIKKWQAPVFITFLLLGLLITVQFRTQQDYLRDLPQQSSDDLVLLFRKNNEKNEELEKILAELESQQNLFNTNISESVSEAN